MSLVISSTEIQKNFGLYHDKALSAPVKVTKYGRETVYIVAAETFHAMKQAERHALSALELSDAEMEKLLAADIPENERYTLEMDDRLK
jgi:antitoxin StbD